MTALHDAYWLDSAACAGEDTRLWFAKDPGRAQEICGGCPVRPECLYDALQRETYFRYGVWGGLTAAERRALPALDGPKAHVIATLRTLLPAPDERTEQPMNDPQPDPGPPPTTAEVVDPAKLPVGKLLAWGDKHADPAVQDQAARARATLAGLRTRYAADQELDAITSEAEELEQRLAQLRARKQELAPAKPGRRKHSYKAAVVRAWAAANGIDCPKVGRVPKAVVDAWRAAGEAAA